MLRNCFNKKIITLLPLFFATFALAQRSLIDSLKKNIASSITVQSKIDAVFALCNEWESFPPDTLYKYALMAKQMAVAKQNNGDIMQGDFYIAAYLFQKNKLDTALKAIDNVIARLLKTASYDSRYITYYGLRSNILLRGFHYDEVLKQNYALLPQAEQYKDTFGIIRLSTGIGNVNLRLKKLQDALKWHYRATSLMQTEQLKSKCSFVYINIAVVFYHIATLNDTRENEDSIEHNVELAIKYSRQGNSLTNLANSLSFYGSTLAEYKKMKPAEAALKEALAIRQKIGDIYYIISDMTALSAFYEKSNNLEKAIATDLEALDLANKNGGSFSNKISIYGSLGEIYSTAKDYEKYNGVLKEQLALQDSIYKKNSVEAISEMETKYEVQKKENIIIKQKLDLTKKNNLIYGTLILLAVTVLISYVIFYVRKKNQQLKMQEVVIDQKRKTMDAVMQAEENERKRIAADLHDSVAQKMVVAKLNLEVLEGYLPVLNQEQRHVYNNIFSLVDDSCTEVRNLSHSMMPKAFFQSGLTDAVKNFIGKIENKNLRISFNAEGELDGIDNNTEIMIYRIIQECLQNIIKHADASKVDISITLDNDEIDVTIEDNGVGFDTSLMEEKEGMGMKNIKSRVDFLNGELDINSTPGYGTVVAFFIPLLKEQRIGFFVQ